MKALLRISMRGFAGLLAAMYLLAPAGLIFAATPKPTCQITVSPTSIQIGGTVRVKWTSTNATAGAITNIGNVGPTGSINLLPSSNAVTTYFGAFTGPGGTTNCQASVAVSSGSTGGGSATIDQTQTNTPSALGVPATQAPTTVGSGLVPCGYGAYDATGANSAGSSTGCQACNLAQLIQNLMTFAIGIAIPIAAALFAYAGFLYITSATNPGNIAKAKSIFKDALIGFVIAITAWLVINTLLHIIFSQGTFSSGNWFTIECSSGGSRAVNNSINKVLSSLPIVAGNTGQIPSDMGGGVNTGGYASGGGSGGGGGVYSCSDGGRVTYVDAEGGYNACVAADGTESAVQCNSAAGYHLANTSDINSASYSGECADQNNQVVDYTPAPVSQTAIGDCSSSALSSTWGNNAAVMSCIVAGESSCNAGLMSRSDVSRVDNNSFSIGLYQINLTAANNNNGTTDLNDRAHNLNLPACMAFNNGQPLNCGQAFAGRNYNSRVVNQDLYTTCVTAAQNVDCNTAAAQSLFQQSNGDFRQWSAYTNNRCGS